MVATQNQESTNGYRADDLVIDRLEECIRRDPARRGLIGSEAERGPLCLGELAGAAADLAEHGRRALIVTGFFIPRGDPPAAETDGPPGAVFLLRALEACGLRADLATDERGLSAVQATAAAAGVPADRVHCFGAGQSTESGVKEFLNRFAGLTHLIAIERVGPSHTLESLRRQLSGQSATWGAGQPADASVEAEFLATVPPAEQNRCHNMRGEVIDEFTAPTHLLFDLLGLVFPQARTIGIGDGGNEIGMGKVPWLELTRRLTGSHAGWVPCRIATDWNILAGTSNWGGYALGAAVAWLRRCHDLLLAETADRQLQILEAMIANGPAVDGVTRRREATVDGLPFLTYIQPWEAMRGLLMDQQGDVAGGRSSC